MPMTTAAPAATNAPMTRAQAIALLTGPGMPHELAEATIQGRALRVFCQAPPTLRELYQSTASDLPFIAFGAERYTFAQAWATAARYAHLLSHRFGVRPGDRVAIAMRNHPEWLLAFCAITALGAVAVAMNAHWQGEEMAHALAYCEAKLLLADAERVQRLAQVAPLPGLQVLTVRMDDAAMAEAAAACAQATVSAVAPADASVVSRMALHALEPLLAGVGEVAMPHNEFSPDDAALMAYTSGSTGHPKGAVSSHRNIISALLSWELDRAIAERVSPVPATAPGGPQAGTLLAVPLFHVTGLHASYLSCYRMQRRLVGMHRWDAKVAAELIDREQLSSMVAPSAMTGDLVREARAGCHSLATLQSVGGGGAARPPDQVRQIREAMPSAYPNTGWGMTETNAIGTSIAGEDYLGRPASSGRCSQVLQIRVVDEAGRALPTGQRGELQVRGTSVFSGYWKRPEANAQVFVEGDWFRTGDVAYLDDEGFLFIVDRIKDLIIRGGENIGCGAVEAALLLHPAVQEAAVYAVPDERLGEEVGATVYTSAPVHADELRQFLAQHLARFEVPRYIVQVTRPLPRTPSGKILKRQIKDEALAQWRA